MSAPPDTMAAFAKKQKQFREWLLAAGAELLEPPNSYEVLRFRANGDIAVVYRDATGVLSWTGASAKIFGHFLSGVSWAGTEKTKAHRPKRNATVRTLLCRDGVNCFYCLAGMAIGTETIEHLVPLAHGGPHHISNFVLAHKACNLRAGHLSAMEKIKMREEAARARPIFADALSDAQPNGQVGCAP